jgi:hypothetical protein
MWPICLDSGVQRDNRLVWCDGPDSFFAALSVLGFVRKNSLSLQPVRQGGPRLRVRAL